MVKNLNKSIATLKYQQDARIKALFTQDILAHNIAIKRYLDKKIILSHIFQTYVKLFCLFIF